MPRPDDQDLLIGVLKALIDKLPFGILLAREDQSIVYCNSVLKNVFTEKQFDQEVSRIINSDFIPSENKPQSLNGHKGILRKEILKVDEKIYQLYFFLFSNNNDFQIMDNPEELLYRDIIDIAYDGLVLVDTEGYVQVLSNSFAEILGVNQQESIGKHVTDVIENTRMHLVVKSGKREVAELQKIRDNYIIATRSPVWKHGRIVGAVGKVVFENVDQVSALSKRLSTTIRDLKQEKGNLSAKNKASYTFDHLIGVSPIFLKVKNQAKKAAKSDSNVLILGESGTGKELFAHAIHNEGKRSMGTFVKVDCAAIPADLMESELFGYEEGSFTGARKGGKMGKFEIADGGTIFLDEIGELPLYMQVKLLRVLQEKEIERVGSNGTVPIDVRIIAATNRNLEKMVAKGEFRLDLYYRLKVIQLSIPSLKERKEDIKILANSFLEKYRFRMNKKVKGIDEKAMYLLLNNSWPGNIRELENAIELALNMIEGEKIITSNHLSKEISGFKGPEVVRPLSEIVEEAERTAIIEYLSMMEGNKSATAKALGISRTGLYERMNKYGL